MSDAEPVCFADRPKEYNVSAHTIKKQLQKPVVDPDKEKAKKEFELKYRVRRKIGAIKTRFHKAFELRKTGEVLAQLQHRDKIDIGFDLWANADLPKDELQKMVREKLALKLGSTSPDPACPLCDVGL